LAQLFAGLGRFLHSADCSTAFRYRISGCIDFRSPAVAQDFQLVTPRFDEICRLGMNKHHVDQTINVVEQGINCSFILLPTD
jgi:hypothetical protein